MDVKVIDEKWKKEWEKLYKAKVDENKDKFFLTVPIPYPDGSLHLGHAYTWGRADIYARFKRMQGYNVLFPQGFHLTGGPLVGMARKIKEKDEKTLYLLKNLYKVSDEQLKKFEDPKELGFYFADQIKEQFKAAGYSIDWDREFRTVDVRFQKFVEWQFRKLMEKGMLYKGSHPVIWCPVEKTPLGDHDRAEGEGESPVEFTIIKFYVDDLVLPASTLRPETVFGVTNIWINPNLTYYKIRIGKENWIVAEGAIIKLENQNKNIEEKEKFDISSLIGKKAKDKVNNKEIPILPADFVTDKGTGIVMSVPAHAPFDYYYLKKIDESIEPIEVIEVPGEQDIVKKSISTFGSDQKGLENATKYVYRVENERGIMKVGPLKQMPVKEARNKVIDLLKEHKVYDVIYDTINKVVCRCGATGIVKIIDNQWFIRYSDEDWKRRALELVNRMKVYPEEAKNYLIASIVSLEDKACTRSGERELGTPFPWDKKQVIEPLSDSTIYMAYYTISHLIKNIPEEDVNDDLFDFVFYNKEVKLKKEIRETAEEMRKEFNYWYPLDIRISAKELLPNHLTFFVMNHALLFDESKWPKSLQINGWLTINGVKMSKSKGNGVLIDEFVENNGIDKLRVIAALGNGMDDEEFSLQELKSFDQRINQLLSITEMLNAFSDKQTIFDDFLISIEQKLIQEVTEMLENFRYRNALSLAFYKGIDYLKQYVEMGGNNRKVVEEYINTLSKLLHPIFPSITEEISKIFDERLLESYNSWPKADPTKINQRMLNEFEILEDTIEDLENLMRRLNKVPEKIELQIADKKEFEIVNKILDEREKGTSFKEIAKIEGAAKYIKKMDSLRRCDFEAEKEVFEQSKEYLEKKFNAKIEVKVGGEKAMPGRPGIIITWK